MNLSIVIPAYREAHKIAKDVRAAGAFLHRNGLSGEVIIADDGSPDGTADVAEKEPVPVGVELRVLRLPHAGKGSAVRGGVLASRGNAVMFADSGVCVPYDDALKGLELLGDGIDVANGSRKMKSSVIDRPQNFYRRTLSRFFRWSVRQYMGIPHELTDTQCGFKVYRGDVARAIFADCRVDGFMFDLEVLLRALSRGYRVSEFPVHWACDPDSRLKPTSIAVNTAMDLRRIKKMVHVDEKALGRGIVVRATT